MNTSLISDSWLWVTPLPTNQDAPATKKIFPVSGIIGILLGLLLCLACIIKNRHMILKLKEQCKKRRPQTRSMNLRQSIGHFINYYNVTTRANKRKSRAYELATINERDANSEETNTSIDDSQNSEIVKHQLVEIEC